MKVPHCLLTLLVVATAASLASAQGFYQNNLWRNPVTGQLQVIGPAGGFYDSGYSPWAAPYRDQRTFYGTDYDPYSGNVVSTQVRRNPITGRLDVVNEFYNPYTGARVESGTRFDPFTQRYQNSSIVTPPSRLPPQADQAPYAPPVTTTAEPDKPPPRTVERPKVIETNPNVIETNPFYLPSKPVDPPSFLPEKKPTSP